MIQPKLFTLETKAIFVLISCVHHFVLSDESNNNSIVNSTDNFNYDEFSNDSISTVEFNQTNNFNESTSELINNGTNDLTSTKTDPVVTEDWQYQENEEQSKRYLSFTTSDEDICTCDLTSNFCDINCCCDDDCTEDNLEVFSKCEHRTLVPDKNYCYQKDIVFRNNTVYKMVKDPESALFCIVHDNLKEHLRFKELPSLKSHRDLDVILKYQSKKVSSWSDKDVGTEIEAGGVRAGNHIYIEPKVSKDKKVETHWSLPSSCFTLTCSCNAEIRYLQDFTSSCTRIISNLGKECETNPALSADTFTNFCFSSRILSSENEIRLTDLVTHTKESNSSDLPNTVRKLCADKARLKPEFNDGLNMCLNVITAVNFIVIHDGFNGIEEVKVAYEYANVSKSFLQQFRVFFEWGNVTNSVKRSGNPGYQVGLPIITGINSSIELDDSFSVTLQPDGLDIINVKAGGHCSNKRRKVKFGYNLYTSCVYSFGNLDCKSLQDRVHVTLLGTNKKQIFIAVFGNANDTNMDDWIEAYHEERDITQVGDTCFVVTDLKINIAFAAVGTVLNPQFKIIGVGYHYGKPKPVDLSCKSLCPGLALTASVSFFDVTEPAVAHYPKVPSIQANLPGDFFYPFLKGKASCVYDQYLVIFMCILFFIVM